MIGIAMFPVVTELSKGCQDGAGNQRHIDPVILAEGKSKRAVCRQFPARTTEEKSCLLFGRSGILALSTLFFLPVLYLIL